MMFDKRFSTRTIVDEVSLDIQLILWNMIERRKSEGITLDYVQIFELTVEIDDGEVFQKVVHKQEVPERINKEIFKVSNPINETIWVVDSTEGAVMMFPSDY